MPADRPCVMSNMLVTIWNSAIDSRLNFGWPKPEPATFCVICWPSRFSCHRSSIAPVPMLLPTSLAVTPFTSFDSSIQLRPWSGSCSIWRRSTLPATCDEVVSTSGVSPMTVSVSVTDASFSVNGIVAFWPTSSSTSLNMTVEKPDSSACSGVLARRHVLQQVLALFVGHGRDRAAGRLIGGGDVDARQHRFRFVHRDAGDGRLLRRRDGADEGRRERRGPRCATYSRGHPPSRLTSCLSRRLRRRSAT